MPHRAFAAIAATSPHWFAPYAPASHAVACRWQPGSRLADALNGALDVHLGQRPLRFVPQDALPPGEAYEAFIARTARVPTRDHPHDLLNALVWSRFPALKTHLNRLQAQEIAARGIGPVRGSVRDALTLFDESGAWLQAPAPLLHALRARDWRTAFVARRADWAEARLTVFGHALMEALLLQPHKGITAHVWVAPSDAVPENFLVAALTPDRLVAKADFPLPLSGVPGWCPANASPDFYDDVSVFRPMRR